MSEPKESVLSGEDDTTGLFVIKQLGKTAGQDNEAYDIKKYTRSFIHYPMHLFQIQHHHGGERMTRSRLINTGTITCEDRSQTIAITLWGSAAEL